jgi:hypothetical protein
LVLIDFTKKEGKELLDFVMKANPEQKIITMSDNFECSETMGCNFCMDNYNRKRVFRPLNLKELLLDKIIDEFNHFSYDAVAKRIFPQAGISESALIEEILEITTLLQDNHIKFQVDENYNINLFIN